MSVLHCDVAGCDNIMCDRLGYVESMDAEFYICRECFERLVSLGPVVNLVEFFNGETPKPDFTEAESRAYWNQRFPDRSGDG